jgi:predicted NUDIX family NTP pyrophosphohydrolase
MAKVSAGILLHRPDGKVLLVHPGGPFFAKKDLGAWSIPKGELEAADEDPRARALMEFAEETGTDLGDADTRPLGEVRLKSGKRVIAFAVEGDLDAGAIVSNTFEMEWPPRSGRRQAFPEVDRAEWFDLDEARERINPAQAAFLDQLTSSATSAP